MTKTKLISIIIAISILKLFGCSDTKSNMPSEAEIEKSIEDFNNRPVHKNLTVQIIDSTNDEELLQLIFNNLSDKLPDDYDKEFKTVTSWNKSRQAIYVIWLLEGEVNNGGFNQFYFNSSGEFAELLPDALELVGAKKFANLMLRANSTYLTENDKITEHQDGTIEGFSKSYEDNPLDEYDDEFYELYDVENLNDLQIEYIRANKSEFVKK